LWLIAPAGADVYKWVDADGLVHYSDEPEAGSKRITLPELSVVPFRVPVVPAPAPSVEGTSETQLPASEPAPPAPGSSSRQPAPPQAPSTSGTAQPIVGDDLDYRLVAIRVPANNETLAAPTGQLNIELALQPELRDSDSIQLFLDGQRVRDQLRTTHFSISGIEAGSHILEARVVGPEGNLVKRSKSVLFHYQP